MGSPWFPKASWGEPFSADNQLVLSLIATLTGARFCGMRNTPWSVSPFAPLLRLIAVTLVSTILPLLVPSRVVAQVAEGEALAAPPELASWIPWVAGRYPNWNCAQVGAEQVCVWPGKAEYTIASTGAEFKLDVEVLVSGLVPLPRASDLAPRDITVRSSDGKMLDPILVATGEELGIKLQPGRYEIGAKFLWGTVPVEIPAPTSYGIINVKLDPSLKGRSARRVGAVLRLEEAQATGDANENASVSIDLFRRLGDGSPLQITTLLRFKVSGKGRSLDLGRVLPDGVVPVSVASELPLSLAKDGKLAVQLIPGEFEVSIDAVAQQPVERLNVPAPTVSGWPTTETWSWFGDSRFRAVELDGVTDLAAALTELPDEWRRGSTYSVVPGDQVEFKVLRRGEQIFTKQSIRLSRELWIDLSGEEFTAIDRFSGMLRDGFRINALPEVRISRASANGEPLFVTKDPSGEGVGVEARLEHVNIEAVSRVQRSSSLSAVGWNTVVDDLSMTLHLPPSWELFGVAGAQSVSGSWIGSWSLLDLFLVLLLGLSFFKLFGTKLAVLLCVALVLSHGEYQAPRIMFIHLVMLVGWRKLLGDSKGWVVTLCQSLIILTFAALVVSTLTYAKLQFTQMLFPQLQSGTRYRTVLQELLAALESAWFSWPALLLLVGYCGFAIKRFIATTGFWPRFGAVAIYGVIGLVIVWILQMFLSVGPSFRESPPTYSASSSFIPQGSEAFSGEIASDSLEESATPGGLRRKGAKALMQRQGAGAQAAGEKTGTNYPSLISGAAIPSWRWRSHQIYVAGPVAGDQSLRLVLLPPAIMSGVCGLRVLISMLLLGLLYKALGFRIPGNTALIGASRAAALVGTLAVLLALPRAASAEYPDETLLKELEQRIVSARCVDTSCVALAGMALKLDGSRFVLALDVSSRGVSGVTLPGPLDVLMPESIKLNGAATVATRSLGNGFLQVKVPNGRSRLVIGGTLPQRPAFALQLPDRPLVVNFESLDWMVSGLLPSGVAQEVLRFSEVAKLTDSRGGATQIAGGSRLATGEETQLSSWVVAHRRIEISESNTVTTELRRIGDVSQGLIVKLPLLTGERITSAGVSVEGQQAVVSFPPGVSTAEMQGLLPKFDRFQLAAGSVPRVSEEWEVWCDQIYSCTFSGLVPSASVKDGVATKYWQPFPGDKIEVNVSQLGGIAGQFVTVDSAQHSVSADTRQYSGVVTASLRVTKESLVTVTLDESATVQSLALDGEQGRGLATGSGASVLVPTGTHQLELRYLAPRTSGSLETLPRVQLSVPTHNLMTVLQPAQDRWLIWTGGALWGPSVVFWSKLLVVCGIVVGLARLGFLNLSLFSSVMLGVGLSSAPTFILGIPLVWLALLYVGGERRAELLQRSSIVARCLVLGVAMLALLVLYSVVETGLVLRPPMLIAGNNSTAESLRWFLDHTEQELLRPWVVTLPLWAWRAFSLVWSAWLVFSLFGWLKRTFVVVKELR